MKKTIKIIIILTFVISLCSFKKNYNSNIDLYGEITPNNYVSGLFNPAKNKLFINLKKAGIPTNNRNHFLRRETAIALKLLINDFNRQHPEIKIFVVSSTRNFYSQKYIWESKWNGKRKVDGIYLNKSGLKPIEKGIKILKYSSMPGTSRHHWGTDFDINNLNNSYFEKGAGRIIYNWMKNNAYKYGFYQPYTAGRTMGYLEEKWHWTYLPLSKYFYKDWIKYYNNDNRFIVRKQKYAGSEELYKLSYIYVVSINSECR